MEPKDFLGVIMSLPSDKDSDQALMAEVFENIPSAIIVIDERGYIKRANVAASNMLNETNMEGRRWVEVIATAFRPRSDDGHEISTRDGRRLQVASLPLKHGQLIQMTDLTETRLLQDKLSHMERLSSLGRMAASLAHQIRTPLSAAMLYGANLANANLQPAARQRFQEKLMSRLEALEAQVSDILMFARSNEQTVTEVDAATLAEQAANNVSAVLVKGNAELKTIMDEGAMPILANATALSGALSNLIANAVEAGAKNVILKLSEENGRVVFSVGNDGPRIPDELRAKIFEPFFTSKSNGTGLGLAVVTAVTKVHQGILSLTSWNETYQTVFNISIPLHMPSEDNADNISDANYSANLDNNAVDSNVTVDQSAGAEHGHPTHHMNSTHGGEDSHADDGESIKPRPLSSFNEANANASFYGSHYQAGGAAYDNARFESGYEDEATSFAKAMRMHADLPPTADSISEQDAHAASRATSEAFAAYRDRMERERAQQLNKANTQGEDRRFKHVEIDVPRHHHMSQSHESESNDEGNVPSYQTHAQNSAFDKSARDLDNHATFAKELDEARHDSLQPSSYHDVKYEMKDESGKAKRRDTDTLEKSSSDVISKHAHNSDTWGGITSANKEDGAYSDKALTKGAEQTGAVHMRSGVSGQNKSERKSSKDGVLMSHATMDGASEASDADSSQHEKTAVGAANAVLAAAVRSQRKSI